MRTGFFASAILSVTLLAPASGVAQQTAPESTPVIKGPIVNGRQLEPTRLPWSAPTTVKRTSPAEKDQLDEIYRDVMARSAPDREPAVDGGTPAPPSVSPAR